MIEQKRKQIYFEFIKKGFLSFKPTHVRIKFYDNVHDLWWNYEASQTSIKFLGDNPYISKPKIVKMYELYVFDEVKKSLVKYLGRNTNKPYGLIQFFGLVWVNFLKLFKIRVANPFKFGEKTEVSAEALYTVLAKIPHFQPIIAQYDPDTIDLCDIMDILQKGGFK